MTPRLVPITAKNTARFATLSVAPDQRHLIAPNDAWLAQAATEHGASNYGIMLGDDAVGLVSLIDPREIPEHGDHSGYHSDCGFLWRLMVDQQFQRSGIALAALRLVEKIVTLRGLTGLTTSTMDLRAGNALPLYIAAGYAPTGNRLHGEIELIKHLKEPAYA